MELKEILKEGKGIIWVNSDNSYEVHDLLEEATEDLEKKKIYEYQEYETIDFETKESLEDLELLNNALEELYPLGLRKVDIFLVIKNASKELGKKKNIELFKEITEIKESNKDYKFTIIIAAKEIPEELKELVSLVDIADESKDDLKKYLLEYSTEKKLNLDPNDINQILQTLKDIIKREDEKIKGGFVNVEGAKVYIPIEPYLEKTKEPFILQEIMDLEVMKFPITDNLCKNDNKIAPWNLNETLDKPVCANFRDALWYYNFLSRTHGYKEVYKWIDNELYIIYANGEETHISLADFSRTEGYRLPRYVEYYWFATGGRKSKVRKLKKDKTLKDLNTYYEEIKDQIGWFNSDIKSRMPVCKKKPNELGLFDIIGNINEYSIDNTDLYSALNEYGLFYQNDRKYIGLVGYIYKTDRVEFRLNHTYHACTPTYLDDDKRLRPNGFRVVRTAYPKY